MPIGTTFGKLIEMTRDEAGHSPMTAVGKNVASQMEQTVRRTYRRLYDDYNWPHLYSHETTQVTAGERYIALPVELDPNKIQEVAALDGTTWRPLAYGIGLPELNRINSELFVLGDPSTHGKFASPGIPEKWDRYASDNLLIEVWPISMANSTTLRFGGLRKPRALLDVEDICDLDDNLVSLYAAGEFLTRQQSPLAQLKLEQAASVYRRLRANSQNPQTGFPIHKGRAHDRGVTIRAPRG